jgi:O-antigen ligase
MAHAPDLSTVEDVDREYRRVAHNTYLEILVGSGLLGLGVFLGIVYHALKNYKVAVKNYFRRGDVENELLANTYRTAFIANLLFFLFSSDPASKLFWMFLALSQISLKLSPKDAAQE